MRLTILLSSIFFLLGLAISSKFNFSTKSNVVDTIVTKKIIKTESVKSLFSYSEEKEEKKSENVKETETENLEIENIE